MQPTLKISLILIILAVIFTPFDARATLVRFQTYEAAGAGVSIDAIGIQTNTEGIIKAEIPTNATVFKAFLYATSVWSSSIGDETVEFEGQALTPARIDIGDRQANPATVSRMEVTDLVKTKLEEDADGLVEFTIKELGNRDGEVLAVLYTVAGEPTYTVLIYDGELATNGDQVSITMNTPVDKTDPDFKAILSLGISFSFQSSSQISRIDINGSRMTSSAGGQDDGYSSSGGLITAGGVDDSISNPPDPNAAPSGTVPYRYDDELYDLKDFLTNGDTVITIDTNNPSDDDNIFFGALTILGQASVQNDPSAEVKDSGGASKTVFATSDNVYITASNFGASAMVDVYVTANQVWSGGETIGSDVGDGVTTLTVNSSGQIDLASIWDATLSDGSYDIIIDGNQSGTFEAAEDAVIGPSSSAGFSVTTGDNNPADKPQLLSPAAEALITNTSQLLNGGTFSDPDNDSHAKTFWKVRQAGLPYDLSSYPSSFSQTATAGNLEEHTVSGLTEGLKYFWQAGYVDSVNGQTVWSDERGFKIGTSVADTSVEIAAGSTVDSYAMFSFIQWPDNPISDQMFGGDLGTTYDKSNFRVGGYDPTIGGYVEYGSNLSVQPGYAIWFLVRNGKPLTVNGVEVSLAVDIDVELKYHSATQDGWNMIGAPNAANYNWADIQVLQRNASGDIIFGPTAVSALADPNDYIDILLYRWEDGTYKDNTTVIVKYNGYWVNAKQANIYLRFRNSHQASLRYPRAYLIATSNRISTWTQKWIEAFPTAIADTGGPPAPPAGGFSSGSSSASGSEEGGCFIVTADSGAIDGPRAREPRQLSWLSLNLHESVVLDLLMIAWLGYALVRIRGNRGVTH